MEDIIDKIKQVNRIEDVIEETGVTLERKRGKYVKGKDHDSLVVNTDEQFYVWNSRYESGDVITWLEKRNNWDFKTAVEWLAKRGKMPLPDWGQADNATRLAVRAREDGLTVAARWFVKRLRASAAAMDYCLARGWTEDTIREAGLGFSGDMTKEERSNLEGEFNLYGVEDGNVRKAIFGIPPGMLVYAHVEGGRVRYLSCRSIEGKRHYNLPKELVGERHVYFNHKYSSGEEEIFLVEGQADAVTLGQWGFPAVAIAGTAYDDHVNIIERLRKRHRIYLGMDADKGGKNSIRGIDNDWKAVEVYGAFSRLVDWGSLAGDEAKDANDVLRNWIKMGVDKEEQIRKIREAMDEAVPLLVEMASWAGNLKGAKQDEAIKRVIEIISKLDPVMVAKYRMKLCEVMGVGIREFNNMVRAARGIKGDEDDKPGEIVEILGGWIAETTATPGNGNGEGKNAMRGWLIEYLYDEQMGDGKFAYRDPDGKIGEANYLDINGIRYVPKVPNSLIRSKGVLFPSKVGDKKSTRELVAIIEAFIHQHYLLDDRFFGRLAAYYVLLSWLYDCFSAIPYLRAVGDYGSGKSQLMIRIGHVCYRMMSTGGAGTSASLFRALDEYRGTAFLDEMDMRDGGDMANELIKILNMGAMANSPVWRLNEVIRADGTRSYDVNAYNIYGPKLITMRGEFRDKATASRCLTIKLQGKEPMELKAKGVKLHLDEAFYRQALAIRNLLLRWRLEKWQPEIVITEDLMDIEVPARLNQVTMPLKALAKDDEELMGDITEFVRRLNQELILERSMGLDARVVDALVAIRENPQYTMYMLEGDITGFGRVRYALTKNITKVANELIDEMNAGEEDSEDGEDGEKRRIKTKGITSQTVGRIARQTLQFQCVRRKNGFAVIFDDEKLAMLKVKYGLATIESVMGAKQEKMDFGEGENEG